MVRQNNSTGFPMYFFLGWFILGISLFVDIWPVPTSLLSDPLLKQTVVKLHSNTNVPLMFVSRNELLNCEKSAAYLNWLFVQNILMKFEVGIWIFPVPHVSSVNCLPSEMVFLNLAPFLKSLYNAANFLTELSYLTLLNCPHHASFPHMADPLASFHPQDYPSTFISRVLCHPFTISASSPSQPFLHLWNPFTPIST